MFVSTGLSYWRPVPAGMAARWLVVQEDVSSAVSPVASHLQAGTDDEQVSATHTHGGQQRKWKLQGALVSCCGHVSPGSVVECSGEQVVPGS